MSTLSGVRVGAAERKPNTSTREDFESIIRKIEKLESELGNAAANDLRNLLEQGSRGAARSANLKFINTLAERKSVESLHGVKLVLSGNATNDASAAASLRQFLRSDPGMRASLTLAGKSAPMYIIVGPASSMFKPLGRDTMAINFGANNAGGKLAGVVVALDRKLLGDRFTVGNELREAALKGNLGLRTRNAEEEAASFLVSDLYRSHFGKPSRPGSAAE